MWDCSKVPEMLFSEFPVFYTNEMIDEVFSGSGGVGIHCSMPIPHLNLKMAVGRNKNQKKHEITPPFYQGSGCNANGLQDEEGETRTSAK